VVECEAVKARFSPGRAARAQEKLRRRVSVDDDYGPIRVVAGVDVAYTRQPEGDPLGVGVAVALSYPSMRVVDCEVYVGPACVPYIPGLLAFRESSVAVPALARLMKRTPIDLIVVDGHGIAHPRGLGIASHLGVVFDTPSIGVAKRILYGSLREVGGREYIVADGRVLGGVIRTKRGSRIYVSPGHRVSVDTALKLISSMMKGYKLPEPTRVADAISKEVKRSVRLPGRIECPRSSSRSRSSG